jgi:hypothetical protein
MFNNNNNQNQQPPAAPAAAPAAEKPVYRYRCTENCTYQGRLRRQGEVIALAEKKDVPHFEFVSKPEET